MATIYWLADLPNCPSHCSFTVMIQDVIQGHLTDFSLMCQLVCHRSAFYSCFITWWCRSHWSIKLVLFIVYCYTSVLYISSVLCQKALSAIFCHFHFFTDYDITPSYASAVKYFVGKLVVPLNSVFWRLNIFLKGYKLYSLISIRIQVTALKGSKRPKLFRKVLNDTTEIVITHRFVQLKGLEQ